MSSYTGPHGQASSDAFAAFARAKKRCVQLLKDCWAEFTIPVKTYHPEHYYMRGPGPKWHAKHSRISAGATPSRDPRSS